MGFCEMIYHETHNFPQEEKEGLARELRTTSIKLLRAITVESIRTPKEFLKSLDETIPIQLDILLLLKLAFRMSFITKRAYQTLEEDLKGLESVANNMRQMHGLSATKWSIHEKVQVAPESQKDDQHSTRTGAKPSQKPDRQSRHDRGAKGSSKDSRHQKPQSMSSNVAHHEGFQREKQQEKSSSYAKEAQQTQKQAQKEVPVSSGKDLDKEKFEGTPLFEEQKSETKSKESADVASSTPEKKSEKETTDSKTEPGSKTSQESSSSKPVSQKSHRTEHKKNRGKGLWSLRRPSQARDEKKSQTPSEESSKKT